VAAMTPVAGILAVAVSLLRRLPSPTSPVMYCPRGATIAPLRRRDGNSGRENRKEKTPLARILRETPSRDRGDACVTGQPQGLGPEAYSFSTSQGSRPEDARLAAAQNGAPAQAGSCAKQRAFGATTLSPMQAGLPDFVRQSATRQGLRLHYQ